MTDSQNIQKMVSGSVHGIAADVEGDLNIYRSAETLADATTEIQTLLEHLESRGVLLETARQQVANEIATEAQENPTSMEKLVSWCNALESVEAEAVASEAAKEVLKVALRQAGVPSSTQS